MADETQAISIQKTPYSGSEAAISPLDSGTEGDEKKIHVVLEPIGDDTLLYPPSTTYDPYNYVGVRNVKGIMLNIETTGLSPWESRIICISVIDQGDPSLPIIHFQDEDEYSMMEAFLAWFDQKGVNEIVGYNVSFDVRFLFVTAMRYRLKWFSLADVNLYDLQSTMKQVFSKYVYGNNPTGTLDDWTAYLFGMTPPVSQAAVLTAFKEKDYDTVRTFAEYKINATLNLYTLSLYTISY